VDLGDRGLTPEELPAIEEKMLELGRQKNEFTRRNVPKAEAIAYFREKGDEYKLELLQDLVDGEITFYTRANSWTYAGARIFPIQKKSKPSS
jgi:threonyl-tRNA synthetase